MKIRANSAFLAVGLVALLISGCHRPGFLGGKPKPPSGQVVAVVDGHEITVRELRAELSGVSLSDPRQMKAAEQKALELIVVRTLLADAALKQGLDKTPDFAIQKQRAIDGLLAQTLEANVAHAVPAPAPEEVDRFISTNVNMFEDRKIFDVDQIRFARQTDPTVVKGLEPINTLDDVAAYLAAHHIAAARGSASLDALQMDPRLLDAITKLPAGELFVIPSGDVVLVNQIKATRVVPLTGPDAKTFATAFLKREHIQEAGQRQVGAIASEGMKRVQFNPAYAPPPSPAKTPGAAAAPAPATNGAAKSVAAP
jgi:EpsD family peptidyl-prolyl cis-trans isomerase